MEENNIVLISDVADGILTFLKNLSAPDENKEHLMFDMRLAMNLM